VNGRDDGWLKRGRKSLPARVQGAHGRPNIFSTEVSAFIADGAAMLAAGGPLIKVGPGTLTMTGLNTHSGGTSFNGGILGILAVNSDTTWEPGRSA
jgi:autotransporter-associated beta strand protein